MWEDECLGLCTVSRGKCPFHKSSLQPDWQAMTAGNQSPELAALTAQAVVLADVAGGRERGSVAVTCTITSSAAPVL